MNDQGHDENWRCSKCKGRNVQRVCWVDPNTKEVGEDFGDYDEHENGKTWCADCEEHTELQLYDPIPHADDCDLDEDCTCGADQADRVAAALQDEADGVTHFRFEAKLDDRTLGAFDKLKTIGERRTELFVGLGLSDFGGFNPPEEEEP